MEQPHRRRSESFLDESAFVVRLGQMQMTRNVEIVRQIEGNADRLWARGMERMWSRLHADERIVPVSLRERPASLGGIERGFPITRRCLGRGVRVVESAGEHQPDADVVSGFDHSLSVLVPGIVEVEEIYGCGCTCEQGLCEGEQCARIDRLAVEVCGERIQNLVPPRLETKIVGEPLEEVLERVTVGVDRAGNYRDVSPVLGDDAVRDLTLWDDANDVVPLDQDGAPRLEGLARMQE